MTMNQFGCFFANRTEFGAGKIALLNEWAAGKSVLFMSDQGVLKSGLLEKITAGLRKSAAAVTEFYDTPTEPSEDDAARIAEQFRDSRPDSIVAVGGGSVLDMSKVLSVLMEGGVSVGDLFEGRFPAGRSVQLIMAPTTSGTGAEATPNSILYRPAQKLKVGIVSGLFVADRIILDPELTLGLPPAVTAATGLDALCHAIESLISNKANPFSDMLAAEALRLIFANLRTVYTDGRNLEARSRMLLASFYAGMCIACAGTNVVHALSYPLGGRYRIPHGVSNAILLAPGMKYNSSAAAEKMASLAGFVTDPAAGLTGADLVIAELQALTAELGIPGKLTELGIPREDLDVLVEDAFKVRRLLDNNPREVTKDHIRAIYLELF